ncbi:MAG: hypothetical protein JWN12_862 [Candidatus Saccharibacteria bacterium]|nr:hypothetical protein [Candidatus Saccharibacteria bacterium]
MWYFVFMNQRLKYFLLFLVSGVISYLSTLLWRLPSYGSALSTVFGILTIILGLTTILLFVKIFTPKRHLLELLSDFIVGL